MKQKWISGRSAGDIASSIEHGIHGGEGQPGDALPPVRALAKSLRVSPVTVAAAYKQLRGRGLIAGEGRRGTRIVPRPASPPAFTPAVIPTHAVDLAGGNPDPDLLPPLDAALRTIPSHGRLYGPAPNLPALVAFAASEFEQDDIPDDHIAVCSGALDAIERILRDHLRAGDVVAIEDPGFPGIRDLIVASGWEAVPFAIDHQGPIPESFEVALRRARAAIVTPRAQNPTGATISPPRATELQQRLKEYQGLLIENDAAGPIAGAPLRPLAGCSERWAFVRSTSKFLGPDLRLALVAGDALTINRVQGRQALGMRWVSHVLQQLVLALWSDPGNGRRVARAADVYAQRRAALIEALATHGVHAASGSGYNVWIPVRDEAQVTQALMEAGWAVAAGERFRIRTGPGIRVTCATLEPTAATRFAADLQTALTAAPGAFA